MGIHWAFALETLHYLYTIFIRFIISILYETLHRHTKSLAWSKAPLIFTTWPTMYTVSSIYSKPCEGLFVLKTTHLLHFLQLFLILLQYNALILWLYLFSRYHTQFLTFILASFLVLRNLYMFNPLTMCFDCQAWTVD